MNIADQVRENLLSIQESLENNGVNLPGILRTIHAQLKKDPEIVTLLSEEECNTLVEGLKEYTKVELATKALKTGGGKALKNTSVDDL